MESLTSNPPQWGQLPCPYCGGKVIYATNARIYHGRIYGNGKCYFCTHCRVSVGVHGKHATRRHIDIKKATICMAAQYLSRLIITQGLIM